MPSLVDISHSSQSEISSDRLVLLGKLATSTAHDLNNLLTIVQIHASIVEDTSTSNEDRIQSGKQISQACQRCADMVKRILMFSKGHSETFEPLQVDVILSDVITLIDPLLRGCVTVNFEVPEAEDMSIYGNIGGLEQIFINLILNAAEAMETPGTITLRCEKLTGQDKIGVTVSDTGSGMDPEIQKRMFEPNFTTKERGSGMGLAIVQDWITYHKGSISVNTTPGQGTTFFISFPTAREQTALPSATPAMATKSAQPLVLVVEDDPLIRNLGAQILVRADFRVFEAENAESAIALWEKHQNEIALLFTDIVLGNLMNGRQLAERLHQDKPSLPVIFTSGYFSPDTEDTDISPRNFLPKPYHPHKLIEMAKSACGTDRRVARNQVQIGQQ